MVDVVVTDIVVFGGVNFRPSMFINLCFLAMIYSDSNYKKSKYENRPVNRRLVCDSAGEYSMTFYLQWY